MQITEFINKLTGKMPGSHRIFPPLDNIELEQWRATWPGRSLPEDLLRLLRHSNGIQFWVNEGSPEGYHRLLPLREINSARRIMWSDHYDAMAADEVPYCHWLAISEHQDGAAYIVLDPDNQRYYLMDTCGADLSNPVGNDIQELLDFIWRGWVEALDDRN
jgi:hypothetical protein